MERHYTRCRIFKINSVGIVGIGTTSHGAKLDVPGTIQSDKTNANGDDANIILRNANAATVTPERRASIWLDNDGKLKFRSVTGNGLAFKDTHNSFDILTINDNGMAIGAALPVGYKLAVNGKILSKESKLKPAGRITFLTMTIS